jgi:hypothetical protein
MANGRCHGKDVWAAMAKRTRLPRDPRIIQLGLKLYF